MYPKSNPNYIPMPPPMVQGAEATTRRRLTPGKRSAEPNIKNKPSPPNA